MTFNYRQTIINALVGKTLKAFSFDNPNDTEDQGRMTSTFDCVHVKYDQKITNIFFGRDCDGKPALYLTLEDGISFQLYEYEDVTVK